MPDRRDARIRRFLPYFARMKTLAIILTIVGAVALIVTAIDYANQSESFKFLGAEITVREEGSLTPLLVSGGVLGLGLLLLLTNKK